MGKSPRTNCCYDFYVKRLLFLLWSSLKGRGRSPSFFSCRVCLLLLMFVSVPAWLYGEDVPAAGHLAEETRKLTAFSGRLISEDGEVLVRTDWKSRLLRWGGVVSLSEPGDRAPVLMAAPGGIALNHWWFSSPLVLAGRVSPGGLHGILRNPLGQGSGSSIFSESRDLKLDASLSTGNRTYGFQILPGSPLIAWLLPGEKQHLLGLGGNFSLPLPLGSLGFRPRVYTSFAGRSIGEGEEQRETAPYISGISGGEISWDFPIGPGWVPGAEAGRGNVQLQGFRSGSRTDGGGWFFQGRAEGLWKALEINLLAGFLEASFQELQDPLEPENHDAFLVHPRLRLGRETDTCLILSFRTFLEKPLIVQGRYVPLLWEPSLSLSHPFHFFRGRMESSMMMDLEADGTWVRKVSSSVTLDKLRGRVGQVELAGAGEISCTILCRAGRDLLEKDRELEGKLEGSIACRGVSITLKSAWSHLRSMGNGEAESSEPWFPWDGGTMEIAYEKERFSLSFTFTRDARSRNMAITAAMGFSN